MNWFIFVFRLPQVAYVAKCVHKIKGTPDTKISGFLLNILIMWAYLFIDH